MTDILLPSAVDPFISKHRVQPMDQLDLAAVARAAADRSPVEAVDRIPAVGVAGVAEDQGAEVVAHNHEAACSVAVDPFDHTGFGLGFGSAEERSTGSGRRAEKWAYRKSWDCSCSLEAVEVAGAVGSLAVEIAGVVVVERSSVGACKAMVWVACRILV